MNAMLRHIGLPYDGSSTPSGFTGTSIIAVTVAAVLGVAIGLGVGAYAWRDSGPAAPAAAAFTLTTEGYTGVVNEALFDGALPLEATARPGISTADFIQFAIEQHDAMFEPYPGSGPVAGARTGSPDPFVGEVQEALFDGTLPLEAPGAMVLVAIADAALEHETLIAATLGN